MNNNRFIKGTRQYDNEKMTIYAKSINQSVSYVSNSDDSLSDN